MEANICKQCINCICDEEHRYCLARHELCISASCTVGDFSARTQQSSPRIILIALSLKSTDGARIVPTFELETI